MSDYCIYWRNFGADCETYSYCEEKPISDWRTSSTKIYGPLRTGDWFWLITGGDKCGMPRRTAAYLVAMFRVASKGPNLGDDAPYPPDDYKYTIWADKSQCIWVAPPLFVDEIVRPGGHPEEKHIGSLLQGPRRMQDDVAAKLRKKLQRDRKDIFTKFIEANA